MGGMPAMVGEAAIDFALPDTDGRSRSLRELHRLGPLVLLFVPSVYGWRPRWQLWSLLRHYDRFIALATDVVVVSADPLPELRIFQVRRGFPFVFLSDRGGSTAAAYHVSLRSGEAASLIINARGIVCYRRLTRFAPRASAPHLLQRLRQVAADPPLALDGPNG